MRVAALLLLIVALAGSAFARWDTSTEAGRRLYDEMDGLYPLGAGVLAAIALVLALAFYALHLRRSRRIPSDWSGAMRSIARAAFDKSLLRDCFAPRLVAGAYPRFTRKPTSVQLCQARKTPALKSWTPNAYMLHSVAPSPGIPVWYTKSSLFTYDLRAEQSGENRVPQRAF